jgi:hypothetical protein
MTREKSDPEWRIAGHTETDSDNEMYMPADVLEDTGIIRDDHDSICWHYADVPGYSVIANMRLEQSRNDDTYVKGKYYSFVSDTAVDPIGKDETTSYRTTVPKKYFSDFTGDTKAEQPVPEHARFEYEESYYFIYHSEMAQGQTRSCYVLSADEMAKVIPEGANAAFTEEAQERADSDQKQIPELGDLPQFFS